MPLMRRVATLGAAVAAARRYARQNPEKVNKYADQAASFVDSRTQGKYRKQIDSALRRVRQETGGPGRGQGHSGASYRGPAYDGPGHPGHPGYPGNAGGSTPGGYGGDQHGSGAYGTGGRADEQTRSYPSFREDRPR